MPVIELSAISKHYEMGQQLIKAVDSLDLTIDYNEYVVFIGSSGSGKSTLMNIIGCLDTPTVGPLRAQRKRRQRPRRERARRHPQSGDRLHLPELQPAAARVAR